MVGGMYVMELVIMLLLWTDLCSSRRQWRPNLGGVWCILRRRL